MEKKQIYITTANAISAEIETARKLWPELIGESEAAVVRKIITHWGQSLDPDGRGAKLSRLDAKVDMLQAEALKISLRISKVEESLNHLCDGSPEGHEGHY